jgi:hypothetical protein
MQRNLRWKDIYWPRNQSIYPVETEMFPMQFVSLIYFVTMKTSVGTAHLMLYNNQSYIYL